MGRIRVDFRGVGIEDGEDYLLYAASEMVDAGYMINQAVEIQYPDGRTADGNSVKITPSRLEYFKREYPIELRDPEGSA